MIIKVFKGSLKFKFIETEIKILNRFIKYGDPLCESQTINFDSEFN